jgi:hypothetical protein
VKVTQYESKTLYYSNPDREQGARVTRDMMVRLCSALGNVFDEEDTREFIGNTRIPNERELYGLLVKALIREFESEIGHVATEVQVARESRLIHEVGLKTKMADGILLKIQCVPPRI